MVASQLLERLRRWLRREPSSGDPGSVYVATDEPGSGGHHHGHHHGGDGGHHGGNGGGGNGGGDGGGG